MLEDLIKNSLGTSIKDRASNIAILQEKLQVLKFIELLRKVEFLCLEFYKELTEQGVYPENYKDWETLENKVLELIDDMLAKEKDPKKREEYIGSKHMAKYVIHILLLHHLDNKSKND